MPQKVLKFTWRVSGDAFTKSNAQKWAVHPTALLFDCHKVFGSAPFVTGIMKSGSPPAKILSIGLGGGSIDSFFLDLPEKVSWAQAGFCFFLLNSASKVYSARSDLR